VGVNRVYAAASSTRSRTARRARLRARPRAGMDRRVMLDRHLDLYGKKYSVDLGAMEGRRAVVELLFDKAAAIRESLPYCGSSSRFSHDIKTYSWLCVLGSRTVSSDCDGYARFS